MAKSSGFKSVSGCPALFKALTLRLTRRVSMRIALGSFGSTTLSAVATFGLATALFSPLSSALVAVLIAGRAAGCPLTGSVVELETIVAVIWSLALLVEGEGGFGGFIAL